MNSFNGKKRAPFGEASTDVSNRKTRATPMAMGGRNYARKKRLEPPSCKLSEPTPRGAPVSGVLAKSGAKAGAKTGASSGVRPNSRPRHPLGRSQLQQRPSQRSARPKKAADAYVHVNPNNDATRARVYKAEAYEAKVRIASQEQRIEALQNELEEVRLFQWVENNNGRSEAAWERDNETCDDAELIEAFAQKIETMENDFGGSHVRVAELERNVKDRSKCDNDIRAAHSREVELKKQFESQRKELTKSQRDTAQGVEIIRRLESNLKAARAERDDSRSQLDTLRAKAEQMQEKITEWKELEVSLKSMQNERDEAIAQLSSSREEVDVLKARCKSLEKLNEDLHSKVEESREMESALEGMAPQFEAKQEKLLSKAAAVEEPEDNITSLKYQHSVETGELKQSHERVISSLKIRHVQELKEKDDQYESRETYWKDIAKDFREELTAAQQKYEEFESIERNYELLNELEKTNVDMEGLHDELQSENSMLKADNASLSHRLQKGLEIHSKTKTELEAKTRELSNAQEEKTFMDTLKKDYSLAVTLSIERGKKILSLQKDAAAHNAQASKLVQRIKNLEERYEDSSTIGAEVADKRWEAEVSSLQSKLSESKAKKSALEHDLANAQKENNASHLKIHNLEEAIRDTKTALKTLSSRNFLPREVPSPMGHEENRRRHIENGALEEYYAHRMHK